MQTSVERPLHVLVWLLFFALSKAFWLISLQPVYLQPAEAGSQWWIAFCSPTPDTNAHSQEIINHRDKGSTTAHACQSTKAVSFYGAFIRTFVSTPTLAIE